jgi:hypothetical protein
MQLPFSLHLYFAWLPKQRCDLFAERQAKVLMQVGGEIQVLQVGNV